MADPALAITGVAIGGPPFTGAVVKTIKYIVSRAESHRHIDDHKQLCD